MPAVNCGDSLVGTVYNLSTTRHHMQRQHNIKVLSGVEARLSSANSIYDDNCNFLHEIRGSHTYTHTALGTRGSHTYIHTALGTRGSHTIECQHIHMFTCHL